MRYTTSMTQELDPSMVQFEAQVAAKVAAGVYPSKEKALEALTELMEEREAKLKWLREQIDRAEEQYARGESIPLEDVIKRFQP